MWTLLRAAAGGAVTWLARPAVAVVGSNMGDSRAALCGVLRADGRSVRSSMLGSRTCLSTCMAWPGGGVTAQRGQWESEGRKTTTELGSRRWPISREKGDLAALVVAPLNL